MREEIWTEVQGFPDYIVSNHGRVRNKRLGSELRPRKSSYGQMRVSLRRDGVTIDKYVHHLVAEAFLTGYTEQVKIVPADGDPSNTHLANIRFMNKRRMGTVRREVPSTTVRRLRIIETGQIFRTVEDCANYLGGNTSSIYRVLRGERFSYQGYTFEFVEEEL